jgi:hypothetical protein
MAQSKQPSIAAFLEAGGAHARFFDMGRRVQPLKREEFEEFETGTAPWPRPLLQQAWFGILFWPREDPQAHYIWFLKLPLDEQGLLNLAARDDFLQRLTEGLGKRKATEGGVEMDGAFRDSPYAFRPKEERMAVFHAKATRALEAPPSRFYEHAREYFSGRPGWDQWSFVGYQGIADMASRLDQDGNETLLADALLHLPQQPLAALCSCLENERISARLAQPLALILEDADADLTASLIRGLSNSSAETVRRNALTAALEGPHGRQAEVLASIVSRAWDALEDGRLRGLFLERLAENSLGQEYFNQAMADLLFIPGMRERLLQSLRDPGRSTALSRAVGALFAAVTDT